MIAAPRKFGETRGTHIPSHCDFFVGMYSTFGGFSGFLSYNSGLHFTTNPE